MIFSRGRGSAGRHQRSDEDRQASRHPGRRGTEDAEPEQDEPVEATVAVGPYDIAEAPTGVTRLDLGSLEIPAIDGVEVRVQAGPEGVVQQVVLVHGDSALQLGVFAAPRSEGIWDEVRAEIRKSLFDDGVAAEEVSGEYGTELRARVRTPEGLADIRFLGIDGPRWMVRAVYQGRAASEPAAAGPLVDCLHGLVVNRGWEAMPVREALPLRLPREVAEQAEAAQAGSDAAAVTGGGPGAVPPGTNGSPAPQARRKPSPRPRRTG